MSLSHYSTTRPLVTAVAAVGTLAVLTACSGSAGTGATDPGSETILVGSDLTYPPYAALDGDTPVGFDPEIVTALMAELGAESEIIDTRFAQLIPALQADQIDLIASALYITAERATEVDYIPYFSTGNSIVVLADAAGYATADDLCGVSVGVITGAAVGESLRGEASEACVAAGKAPIDVRDFATDPEATQAVLAGQVQAQVTDAAVAAGVVEQTEDRLKISSDSLLYPIPVGLAVKKGNDDLREKIESALEAITASGVYQDLLDKYNLEAPDEAQVDAVLNG
jgi:ABC-type amino acid transport substrate-binding protein